MEMNLFVSPEFQAFLWGIYTAIAMFGVGSAFWAAHNYHREVREERQKAFIQEAIYKAMDIKVVPEGKDKPED